MRDLDTNEVNWGLRQILEAGIPERAKDVDVRLQAKWERRCPKLLAYVEPHREAILAVLNVPENHRTRFRTSNYVEQANQKLERRGSTIRIWPNAPARDRRYGALLMEQNERWSCTTWLKPASEGVAWP